MQATTASHLASRLFLGLLGAASLSVTATALQESEGASPWTPPVLEVGVDLGRLTFPVTRPASQPTVLRATDVGPQLPPPAAGGHDHDGDGVEDHAPGDHDGASQGGASQGSATQDSGGRLALLEGDNHDFGALVQGAVVEHTFVLQSIGEAPLVVSSVKASCGCTVATSQRVTPEGVSAPYAFGEAIEPGDRLLVTARLNTEGKKNRMQSTLTVFSNDPAQTHMLRLAADVQPFFELTPNSYIQFGKMYSNEQRTEVLRVTSPIADRFRLELAQAVPLPEHVKVELRAIDADASGRAATWDVVATVGPNAPEGPSSNWPLRLTSDVPVAGAPALPDGSTKTHAITAYAVAQVVGLVSANPYYVSFGLVRPGQEIEKEVVLEVADAEFEAGPMPVTIRAQRAGDEDLFEGRLTASVVRDENDSRKHRVKIKLTDMPDDRDGPFGGYFDIAVGHPTKPTLTIPFSGVLRTIQERPAGGR